jgi:hypothetical protein
VGRGRFVADLWTDLRISGSPKSNPQRQQGPVTY